MLTALLNKKRKQMSASEVYTSKFEDVQKNYEVYMQEERVRNGWSLKLRLGMAG